MYSYDYKIILCEICFGKRRKALDPHQRKPLKFFHAGNITILHGNFKQDGNKLWEASKEQKM